MHGVVLGKSELARGSEAPVTSEEEKNKALVRRSVEAQWEMDLAALEEVMAPDFVDHSVLPGQGTTREDYLQDLAEEQPASSEARLSIEDQMAEDDKVITRLAIHGSHDQEMFTGVPPTGVQLKFTGVIRGAKGQGDAPGAYGGSELRAQGDGARCWRGGPSLQRWPCGSSRP